MRRVLRWRMARLVAAASDRTLARHPAGPQDRAPQTGPDGPNTFRHRRRVEDAQHLAPHVNWVRLPVAPLGSSAKFSYSLPQVKGVRGGPPAWTARTRW